MAAGGADILIAGAGPTGLAAALFLSHRGIVPRIVEQSIEASRHSKAFGVNPRALHLGGGRRSSVWCRRPRPGRAG